MCVSTSKKTLRAHKRTQEKASFYAEIKWTNVSPSKLPFYIELIDYFFDTDLKFRTVAVRKEKIMCKEHQMTFDDFTTKCITSY